MKKLQKKIRQQWRLEFMVLALGGQPGEPSVHFDLLSSGSLVAPSGSLVVP